ncbi:AzlD domain-containing protein [Domibacillus epiphyticus]|uniref:Branched-chain amino acid transporter n=1 Tax=Domibacillus epiphyticus TaxID=1714355 RepID=A0A1V2A843_9BACI|nr:AzlD domain-containing protein [Domibacillus epiphyticus]OMP67117.1 branched-chain amino acid transporter [Domibacillus epiphyticus]
MSAEMAMIVFGMAAVTYIPRMLPFLMFKGKELPAFWQGILRNVPYATLGALIFPGILTFHENLWFGIAGAGAAFLIAFTGANIIFTVIGSIGILTVLSML